MTGRLSICPSCGGHLGGITTTGPNEHRGTPCGCDLGSFTIDEIAQYRRIPDDHIKACPDCDTAGPQYNSGSCYGAKAFGKRYHCRQCGSSFNVPEVRLRRGTGARRGLAGRLEDADPDDVGGELVTDGGTKQTEVDDEDLRAAIERVVQRKGAYFKAKDVAAELDVSPHAAGHLLAAREDVEKWGYSANATTWHYPAACQSEAVTDGGVLRRCGHCDTLNNVVVNGERCYSCGQSWGGESS